MKLPNAQAIAGLKLALIVVEQDIEAGLAVTKQDKTNLAHARKWLDQVHAMRTEKP